MESQQAQSTAAPAGGLAGRPWFRTVSTMRYAQPAATPPPPQPQAQPPPPQPAPRPAFTRSSSLFNFQTQTAPAPPPPLPPVQSRPRTPTVAPAPSPPRPAPVRVSSRPSTPASPQTKSPSTAPSPAQVPTSRYQTTPPVSPKVIRERMPMESGRMEGRSLQEQGPRSPPRRAIVVPNPPPTPPPPRVAAPPLSNHPEPESRPQLNKVDLYPKKSSAPPPTSRSPPRFKEENKTPVAEKKKSKKAYGEEAAAAAMTMLTIAGENTGAYMEIGSNASHRSNGGVRRSSKPEPFTGRSYYVSHDEANGKVSGSEDKEAAKKKVGAAAARTRPMAALVNSNVQGVNDSVMLNSTCLQGSPGVHVRLSRGNNHRRAATATAGEGAISK